MQFFSAHKAGCRNPLSKAYIAALLIGCMQPWESAGAADNPAGSTINGQLGNLNDTVFTNEGNINNAATIGYTGAGIYAGSANTVINNSGEIVATGNAPGVYLANNGSILSFVNSGSIISRGASAQAVLLQTGRVNTFTNSGLIQASGGYNAIWFQVPTTLFVNTGTVTSGGWNAIYNVSTIDTITNLGTIYSTSSNAYHYGIYNDGTITTLNNSQGGSSPLQITQHLPVNYNIIINSASNYGRLSGSAVSGTTNFGVYTGSLITQQTYTSVLSGLAASNLGATSGSYGAYQWELVNAGGNIWNLIFTNFTTNVETKQAVALTADMLGSASGRQRAMLANTMQDYDCALFGAKDLCISGGGRVSVTGHGDASTNGYGLLTAAYRLSPQLRLGGYLDQALNDEDFGGGVHLNANTPTSGIFGVWNAQPDGYGAAVKLAAAYSQRKATIQRPVVDNVSEPGTGSTDLTSFGALALSSYTLALKPESTLAFYLGLRYSRQQLDGYQEDASAQVSIPLSYAPLSSTACSAVAGVNAGWQINSRHLLQAGLGMESDLYRRDEDLMASGITGLGAAPLYGSIHRQRVTGTLAYSYLLSKTQRINIAANYRQGETAAIDQSNLMLSFTAGF